MLSEEAAVRANRQSSSVIWESWSLLLPAQTSRGGSHLTQLLPSTQLGVKRILTAWQASLTGGDDQKSD